MQNAYERNGYTDREEYLDYLLEVYDVSEELLYCLADFLGPNEDFDGLINALEEL